MTAREVVELRRELLAAKSVAREANGHAAEALEVAGAARAGLELLAPRPVEPTPEHA